MRRMGLEEKKHYTLEEIKEEQYNGERVPREGPDDTISAEELDEVYAEIEKRAGKDARRGELHESWGEL